MDFEALQQASKKSGQINTKVQEKFVEAYGKALFLVSQLNQKAAQNPGEPLPQTELQNAADTLLRALALKPSLPHPYALLSYLFFLMENQELAWKYLEKAEAVDAGFPKVQELKQFYASQIQLREKMSAILADPEVASAVLESMERESQKIKPLNKLSLSMADDGGFDLPDF